MNLFCPPKASVLFRFMFFWPHPPKKYSLLPFLTPPCMDPITIIFSEKKRRIFFSFLTTFSLGRSWGGYWVQGSGYTTGWISSSEQGPNCASGGGSAPCSRASLQCSECVLPARLLFSALSPTDWTNTAPKYNFHCVNLNPNFEKMWDQKKQFQ